MRATIEVSADQKVVTRGPNSVVRRPMYGRASVLLISTPIALGSWVAILLAFLLILVTVARLLDEEQLLLATLSGYEEYHKAVGYRLIPFIW